MFSGSQAGLSKVWSQCPQLCPAQFPLGCVLASPSDTVPVAVPAATGHMFCACASEVPIMAKAVKVVFMADARVG